MPSSKLDYLSKYTSSISSSNNNKKDRKKKKKKKEEKQNEKKLKQGGMVGLGTTALHDDNDNEIPEFHQKNEDNEDEEPLMGEEDEGPIVVDTGEMDLVNESAGSTGKTLGVWQEVDLETGAISTINKQLEREHSDIAGSRGGRREGDRRYDSSTTTEQTDNANKHHRPTRHESDSCVENSNQSPSPRKRKRHDSEGRNSKEEKLKSSGRKRHDSDVDDSDDSDREINISRSSHRRRHDSDYEGDSEDKKKPETVRSSRRRHDSDDDDSSDEKQNDTIKASRPKRRRHDSDSDSESRERMPSGHKAGLQHHNDFNKSEQKIQKQKHKDAQMMVDKYGMGETVYRDKDGRKLDKPSRDKLGQTPSTVDLDSEAQRRLNQGKVQQQALEAKAQEMVMLHETPFARHQDDDLLEDMRKNEIRKGDPMAHYAAKKQKKSAPISGSGVMRSGKPIYKGPPPKPNRYGIRPGYRWDGVDRGNGFEDKILAQKYSAKQKEEQAYRWRSADM
jgi:pre-mRNA-splicing factor CWC26